jgi:hypothetical protein
VPTRFPPAGFNGVTMQNGIESRNVTFYKNAILRGIDVSLLQN